MASNDHLHRFTLEQNPLRGEIVQLSESYKQVLEKQAYPELVQTLLGEFIAAAALLSATIKFEGILSLQVRGDGPVSLLMAECRNQTMLRAIASFTASPDLPEKLFGEAQLAITIEPHRGQSYQGIVSFENGNLSSALEDYFLRSEQLPTRIWLAADAKRERAAGLMIQALPDSASQPQLSASSEDWARAVILSETLSNEELMELAPETLLYRLYHEEQVRLYPATELAFGCSCSRERSANSLLTIGQAETQAALTESGGAEIEIACHFCHTKYLFSEREIAELFASQVH